MAQRPSEPILEWLRNTLKAKNLNVAALAEKSGQKRSEVKRVLAGREPLTVDQLMTWTKALDLKMEELVNVPELSEDPPPAPVAAEVDESRYIIDPYGLQAEQAIRVAFAMGSDFTFLALTDKLEDCGVPASTLENPRFSEMLPIRLEAAYHGYNNPEYTPQGLSLTLSFDTIRECFFPWSAIVEVRYHLDAPAPEDLPVDELEDDDGGPEDNVVNLFG
ncbi:MAG: helix-turn-helix transcriptional regulator [Proteobacteria bacterium]|nr:helix-turn-helix transcriptional regulator [Pseudomonadota bacterium]